MQRIYLSGPMTGLPDYNYPAFNAEAARLRALGYSVENPAENPLPADAPWHMGMRDAIRQMLTCDTAAFLPGWQTPAAQTSKSNSQAICAWLSFKQAASFRRRRGHEQAGHTNNNRREGHPYGRAEQPLLAGPRLLLDQVYRQVREAPVARLNLAEGLCSRQPPAPRHRLIHSN
ncbi:DUF4406 domain-containing protein [Pseudomonas sp. Ps21-P2]|uniref:DUF4406 domain-containing protein n=1 Tax=Pseudomonas sp. Ps21-P2 TaxID=3080331 RepID=UPI003209300C